MYLYLKIHITYCNLSVLCLYQKTISFEFEAISWISIYQSSYDIEQKYELHYDNKENKETFSSPECVPVTSAAICLYNYRLRASQWRALFFLNDSFMSDIHRDTY
ncbi:hypothetical protein B5X24_HaOG212626 [Helicoverpa armigera]|nr:hypothetical protein B5X24_HaOG212626 [Helicoverpa armigera]